jgi:hypothetical protein
VFYSYGPCSQDQAMMRFHHIQVRAKFTANTFLWSGRSRARRKEYLQELEAKIRSCEQVGIEASSEIQTAARRVLDENKKLRALLHERGVSESEIIIALEGSTDRAYDQTSGASALNTVLERRITYNTPSLTSSPAASHLRAASLPRHPPSVPPINIPVPRSTALSSRDSLSPGSMVSSMGTPPPIPYHTTIYTTPMTPTAPEIKTEDVRYGYSYDQSFNNGAWHYSSDYNLVAEPETFYTPPSCVSAAHIIRSMRSNTRPEPAGDLGGRVPLQDYYVNGNSNNNMMFDMIDKYTNPHSRV